MICPVLFLSEVNSASCMVVRSQWGREGMVYNYFSLSIKLRSFSKVQSKFPSTFFFFFFALKKNFYWSIIDLKCCVNFCRTEKWFSYTYILFPILFHSGLSQDIEYNSLCYTVGPCWELGISRCKLVYIEWLNNKVLEPFCFRDLARRFPTHRT